MTRNVSFYLGVLAALIGTTAFAGSTDCKDVSQFKEIDKKALTDLIMKKQVFVVDVNDADSYNTHHIPTAIHFGDYKKPADFASALPQDPNAMIVAYCGGLQCTAWEKAATAACSAKHTNIRHFKPGITGWMADNQTFFDAKTRNPSAIPNPQATSSAQ